MRGWANQPACWTTHRHVCHKYDETFGKQTLFSSIHYIVRLSHFHPLSLSSTAIQIPHYPVSSPGMPSNFHLNFIPGSLDEIHFGLGKTTKLLSFSDPKNKRVEASRKIEVEEKERKREKVFPHFSHSLVSQSQLSTTIVM